MIKVITSKDNTRVKYAASLQNSKYRKINHQFLCEGYKALEMALDMGLVYEVFTLKEIPELSDDITQYVVSEDLLKKISFSVNPEGIVFIANEPNYSFDDSFQKVVYLDDVQDPGNLGTIIRTALAFDFDAVVLSKNCVSPYNDKVVASTKGAIFKLPIIVSSLEEIKNNKKVIVTALASDAVSLSELEVKEPFILVLGNEAHGVKEETIKMADVVVKIPISNAIDSINVAIAGGILMHHLSNIE